MRLLLRRAYPPLVAVAVLGLVWEWRGRGSTVLPPPSRVVRAFWATKSLLPKHLATTLTETALGVSAGVAGGLAVAALVALSPWLARALQPLVLASQTIPVQVLGPILVLIFGFGIAPKAFVVALVVGFPVAVATTAGLRSADAELVDLVRSYGASRRQLFRFVLGPAAIPGALAGLRISLTYAVAAAVIGESLGGTSGLGLYIERSRRGFRYDQVLVGVVVVTIVSVLLFSLVAAIDRLLCPWRRVLPSVDSL
jgi:ABC-type nitrate/sulfonate/bicarbonate transport system permease component